MALARGSDAVGSDEAAAVATAQSPFHLWICARDDTLASHYRAWLSSANDVTLLSLGELLGAVATTSGGGSRLDLGGRLWHGMPEVIAKLTAHCTALDRMERAAAADGAAHAAPAEVVLMVNHCRVRDSDIDTLAFFLEQKPSIAHRLSEVWCHHNHYLSDGCGSSLARIIATCPSLAQLHASDTQLGVKALQEICIAAAEAGCGRGRRVEFVSTKAAPIERSSSQLQRRS